MFKFVELFKKRDGSCGTMIWFLRHNITEVFQSVELCSKRNGSCGTMIWFLRPNIAESMKLMVLAEPSFGF